MTKTTFTLACTFACLLITGCGPEAPPAEQPYNGPTEHGGPAAPEGGSGVGGGAPVVAPEEEPPATEEKSEEALTIPGLKEEGAE